MIIKNVSLFPLTFPAQKVLHLRSAGARRQKRPQTLQSLELPKHDESEALHLHNADAFGRRLEPDSVQLVRLHKKSLRHKLHRNAQVKIAVNFCRVQIHANCRIRRIYFSDRLYTEDELPPEFKLFLPVAGKQ